jgi:hypothetical protein
MPLQWQGWRPAGLTPPPNPAGSQESRSRVQPAPLRGLGALAVPEQAARRHRDWHRPRRTVPHSGGDAVVRAFNARVREQACACGAPSSEAEPARGDL